MVAERTMGLVLCLLLAAGVAAGGELKELAVDGFRVQLPGMPKEQTEKKSGVVLKTFTLAAEGGVYRLVKVDAKISPDETREETEARLNFGSDETVESVMGELVTQRRIHLADKYPGRQVEVMVPGKDRFVVRKFYLIEGSIYSVTVEGSAVFVASPESRRFLSSVEWKK